MDALWIVSEPTSDHISRAASSRYLLGQIECRDYNREDFKSPDVEGEAKFRKVTKTMSSLQRFINSSFKVCA